MRRKPLAFKSNANKRPGGRVPLRGMQWADGRSSGMGGHSGSNAVRWCLNGCNPRAGWCPTAPSTAHDIQKWESHVERGRAVPRPQHATHPPHTPRTTTIGRKTAQRFQEAARRPKPAPGGSTVGQQTSGQTSTQTPLARRGATRPICGRCGADFRVDFAETCSHLPCGLCDFGQNGLHRPDDVQKPHLCLHSACVRSHTTVVRRCQCGFSFKRRRYFG